MKAESIEPDSWIVPPRMTTYAAMGQLAETEVYRAGESTARANLMKGADNFTTFRGKAVHEIKPYNIDVDGRVVDPLNRSRMIGDFFVVPYDTATQVYCCQSDRFETFTYEQCAKKAGLKSNLTAEEMNLKRTFPDLFNHDDPGWIRARRRDAGLGLEVRGNPLPSSSSAGPCMRSAAEGIAAQVPDFDARAHALLPQMSAGSARQAILRQLAIDAEQHHATVLAQHPEMQASGMQLNDFVDLFEDPEGCVASAASAVLRAPQASGSYAAELLEHRRFADMSDANKQETKELLAKHDHDGGSARGDPNYDQGEVYRLCTNIRSAFEKGFQNDNQHKHRLKADIAFNLLCVACEENLADTNKFCMALMHLTIFVLGFFNVADTTAHLVRGLDPDAAAQKKKEWFLEHIWPKRKPDLIRFWTKAIEHHNAQVAAAAAPGAPGAPLPRLTFETFAQTTAKGLFAIADEAMDILCLRPFRQYTMGTGVLCRSGSELGNTFRCASAAAHAERGGAGAGPTSS